MTVRFVVGIFSLASELYLLSRLMMCLWQSRWREIFVTFV